MAVKEGLPATDFSKMNRDYIRNVAEGETVKDGLPATDFSRMNREYIKAVVEEAGGGGGDITVEPLSVTANDTYTAPEGKAYSPVTVNVTCDFDIANITITKPAISELDIRMAYVDSDDAIRVGTFFGEDGTEFSAKCITYKGSQTINLMDGDFTPISYDSMAFTGDIAPDPDGEGGLVIVSGDGTITIS